MRLLQDNKYANVYGTRFGWARAYAIKKKSDATAGQKREVKFALGSAIVGLIMGALGVKMTLASL